MQAAVFASRFSSCQICVRALIKPFHNWREPSRFGTFSVTKLYRSWLAFVETKTIRGACAAFVVMNWMLKPRGASAILAKGLPRERPAMKSEIPDPKASN